MANRAIKILAIDDIHDNLISLNALVKEAFPEILVYTALSGEKGLELAADEDPDVILLDIIMPGMDGFEVCRKLKSDKKLCDIPVVFVTALKGDKASRIRALEAGAEGFLAKPIDETELTAQIRAMVKIKNANIEKRDENFRLFKLVEEQTCELRKTHAATLKLLEDLQNENAARKKSEETLREREAFLNKLLETIPVPIFYKDRDGRYAGFNQAFERFFGKGLEDLLGKSVFDINPPELAKIYHAQDALLFEKSQGQIYDSQVKNANGSLRDVVFHKASITDTHESVTGLIGVIIDITERKRTEDDLARNQMELKAIYDHAPVMMCLVDSDLHIIYANPALKTFIADPESKFEGRVSGGVLGCINALDDPRGCGFGPNCQDCSLRLAMEDTLKTGTGHHNVEYHTTLVSGGNQREVWLLGATVLVRTADQNNLLLCLHDITERKQSEEALRESETRYMALFNYINSGVAIYRPIEGGKDFVFVNVNEAGEKISRINNKEVIGKRLLEIFPNMGTAGLLAVMQQVYYSGSAVDMPEFKYKDDYREGWRKNFVYKLPSGEIVAIYDDITERKRSEEATLHKDALLGAILRNLPFDFWARDTHQGIIMQSDESIHFWGDLALDSTLDWQFDDRTVERWRSTNRRALDGEVVSEDCTYITKTGECREFHNIVAPIREDKDILGILGINIDITERKRAEEERKSLQVQLVQAQKMEAIGTLAGGIAHDFNNILGAILGYAEMAQDDCPPGSPLAQDITQILKSGYRAKELVKQILAFSRQAETEQIPLQPALIVKEAVKMLRASLPSTIAIKQDIDFDAGLILADPTQIHQIVMNLCTNAFHSMETEGGTLTISLKKKVLSRTDFIDKPQLQPGNYIQLLIRDTGVGISPEIREKIFEPYFTTKEVGKGTGMGLAVVHGIVQSYGGSIVCDSQLGEGTVFRITLPTVDTHTLHENESAGLLQVGKEHILLIDDEEILAEMGKNMLERLGYHVTTRTNSIEALTTFQNQPDLFDVVITDQTMPGMTGSDLARRMLQIRPDLPIVLCTGYSNLISEEKARSLGIKGFAMKPLAKKDIAAIIRHVLDGGVKCLP